MLVFLCPLGQSLDSNFEYAASTSSVQASQRGRITPPSQKSAAQLRIPPPPSHLNLSPRLVLLLNQRYSQLTVKNEPLGDITRSDVKDVAANNNTKQLFTEVVPTRKVARLTTSYCSFIHFHPIYYLKGYRALGNSILRNSSSECQNQD